MLCWALADLLGSTHVLLQPPPPTHTHTQHRYCILFISIIQVCVAMFAMSSRGGTESFVRCVRAALQFVGPDFVPPTYLL